MYIFYGEIRSKSLRVSPFNYIPGVHVTCIVYGALVISAISTILLCNSANLAKLLCAGVILATGIFFLLWSSRSRKKGQALVQSGPYAFVRHPEFLGHILIIFALIIVSQHWISFIVGAILIVLLYLAMIEEERRNVEKFVNAYRDYMRKVPRINLIAGIIRRMRSK